MVDAAKGSSLQLSAAELKTMTKWPDAVIYEFLALEDTIITALLRRNNVWTGINEFTNFTALGGPAIKVLKFEGTTGVAAGDTVSIPHGLLDFTKIISLTGTVNDGTTGFVASDPDGANLFSLTYDATNINVVNGAAATAILAQPFAATVIVEA